MNDFDVVDHGSITLLFAITPAAAQWVEEHLPEDRQTWARNGTVIEPRYLGDILQGIQNDGLAIG